LQIEEENSFFLFLKQSTDQVFRQLFSSKDAKRFGFQKSIFFSVWSIRHLIQVQEQSKSQGDLGPPRIERFRIPKQVLFTLFNFFFHSLFKFTGQGATYGCFRPSDQGGA
jgi:hypothetical protein